VGISVGRRRDLASDRPDLSQLAVRPLDAKLASQNEMM